MQNLPANFFSPTNKTFLLSPTAQKNRSRVFVFLIHWHVSQLLSRDCAKSFRPLASSFNIEKENNVVETAVFWIFRSIYGGDNEESWKNVSLNKLLKPQIIEAQFVDIADFILLSHLFCLFIFWFDIDFHFVLNQ